MGEISRSAVRMTEARGVSGKNGKGGGNHTWALWCYTGATKTRVVVSLRLSGRCGRGGRRYYRLGGLSAIFDHR